MGPTAGLKTAVPSVPPTSLVKRRVPPAPCDSAKLARNRPSTRARVCGVTINRSSGAPRRVGPSKWGVAERAPSSRAAAIPVGELVGDPGGPPDGRVIGAIEIVSLWRLGRVLDGWTTAPDLSRISGTVAPPNAIRALATSISGGTPEPNGR